MRSARFIACAVAAAAAVAVATGCSAAGQVRATLNTQGHSIASQIASPPSPAGTHLVKPPSCGDKSAGHYVGLSVPGYPPDDSKLAAVERKTGIPANVVSMYFDISAGIIISKIKSLCAHGALPFIEIDSDATSLKDIVAGKKDPVLAQEALRLSTLEIPVAIDFDHEFNGPWWRWGYTHVTSAEFVAAWRHIVDVFRANGATNVTWVWNPNVDAPATVPDLRAWYPGDKYVTWIGMDGYFTHPGATFASVFQPTMDHIRSFAKKPFLIVETGANPASGRVGSINSLFQGAAATPDLLGLIWFDYDKFTGHNWLIDDDAAALKAFHSGATTYQK